MIRAIPEIIAYPYPIGYDVINYYIPVVTNFESHWPEVSVQFPLYVLLLYSIHLITGLSAHASVAAIGIVIFGAFGTSIYYLGRSLIRLGIGQSIFLAGIVAVQMAVLRTAWDLHRDIFALTTMMIVFSLLGRKDLGRKGIIVILLLVGLTVSADRMIGALFCVSLAAYTFIVRRKKSVMVAIFAVGLFSILMISSNATSGGTSGLEVISERIPTFYKPQNLMTLFLVANGLILLPAVIGFFYLKNSLLRIILLVSLAASFSWILFPDTSMLLADRWIILSGIFFSIFAGYGILRVIKNLKPRFSMGIACSVLAVFSLIGLAYATSPQNNPFILYGAARDEIEQFAPVTMQFNSLDIQDNPKMISTIAWINQNTERDTIIVGEKHWRGFMELYLEDERTYRFSHNPEVLAGALERRGENVYIFRFDGLSVPTIEDGAIR